MILYHGTSKFNADKIIKNGFTSDKKYNWHVKSKEGFVYLSLAYAPFYAMAAKNKSKTGALIQVYVSEDRLYPDEDFIMYALGAPSYTQEQLDELDLENYKSSYKDSLKYLGNACAKSIDIIITGVQYFDMEKLIMVCDPSISPINYKFMGEYYQKLTEWIYTGGRPEEFRYDIFSEKEVIK